MVFGKYGFYDFAFGYALAWQGRVGALGLEVVHMKAQDVAVFNGVGDGVLVQAALKNVVCGAQAGLLAFDLAIARVFLEYGCACKAKELRIGEKFFDGFVVVAKLRAVAFVKDEYDALLAQWLQALFVVALVSAIKG